MSSGLNCRVKGSERMGLIAIRYGEIGLKGKNQLYFLKKLRRNVKDCLKKNGLSGRAERVGRRIYVYTDEVERAVEGLRSVFGITSLSPASQAPPDIEAIQAEALCAAQEAALGEGQTFRIEARRADKTFPLTSPEIERLVGAHVKERTGAGVDLSEAADLTIGIEVIGPHVLVFGRKVKGLGGMPLTSEGRVVALTSDGIDSPVAAWLMMKRGCGVIPLHFSQNETAVNKFLDICQVLARYAYGWDIRPIVLDHEEVFGPTLEKLRAVGAERWACIFCKRALLAKASQIADEHKAKGIVTGESMGQVASQTLDNMQVISYGLDKPVLRPLIGLDKVEIVALARRIGTYEISARASQGCVYVPPHPLTRASLPRLRAIMDELAALEE